MCSCNRCTTSKSFKCITNLTVESLFTSVVSKTSLKNSTNAWQKTGDVIEFCYTLIVYKTQSIISFTMKQQSEKHMREQFFSFFLFFFHSKQISLIRHSNKIFKTLLHQTEKKLQCHFCRIFSRRINFHVPSILILYRIE